MGIIYSRISVASRTTAIVGVVVLALLYGLILMDGEGLSGFTIWLLLLAVFVAAPMEIFGLLLSFFKEKIGYKLSLVFGIPLFAVAVGFVFVSAKELLFETQNFDILLYLLLLMSLFLMNIITLAGE